MINNQKQHIHSDLSQNLKPGEDYALALYRLNII